MSEGNCCPTDVKPIVTSNYKPTGQFIDVEGLKVYETGKQCDKAIIIGYDIFGIHPNTQQVCDILAAAGYYVVMPDFFKGNPWPLEGFPPKDWSGLKKWIGEAGTWEVIQPDFKKVVAFLKEKGATKMAFYGFCWGVLMALHASATGLFKVCGGAHPASLCNAELMSKVKSPIVFLPSKDEQQFEELQKAMKESAYGSKCHYQRFDDMHHGWCSARADFTNELNVKRTHEALGILLDHCKKNMV
mmetsp:Transcript_11842/g.13028  ORF Transcript_11842/g.13028 Transcript_11842/m.13028 type:complete len:244 (-) Transcript_11842:100-831(-)